MRGSGPAPAAGGSGGGRAASSSNALLVCIVCTSCISCTIGQRSRSRGACYLRQSRQALDRAPSSQWAPAADPAAPRQSRRRRSAGAQPGGAGLRSAALAFRGLSGGCLQRASDLDGGGPDAQLGPAGTAREEEGSRSTVGTVRHLLPVFTSLYPAQIQQPKHQPCRASLSTRPCSPPCCCLQVNAYPTPPDTVTWDARALARGAAAPPAPGGPSRDGAAAADAAAVPPPPQGSRLIEPCVGWHQSRPDGRPHPSSSALATTHQPCTSLLGRRPPLPGPVCRQPAWSRAVCGAAARTL